MNRAVIAFGLFALLMPVTAQAAPILVVDTNGLLTGATGVLVEGRLYDVDFVEGTCTEVFGVCDEAHFAFTTESSSLAASRALVDQVFLDVPGLGNFDSEPMLTKGCFLPTNCWALTPYQIMGSNFLITHMINVDAILGDGAFMHTGDPSNPGLSIFGSATDTIYDSSADINGVLARWTAVPQPVPEPASGLLFGVGLAVAAGWRRRQTRVLERSRATPQVKNHRVRRTLLIVPRARRTRCARCARDVDESPQFESLTSMLRSLSRNSCHRQGVPSSTCQEALQKPADQTDL